MQTKLTGFATLALLIALVGAPPAAAQDRFEWDQAIAPGKTIEIKGISGSIVASPTSGNHVEVVAIKDARRSDTDSVTIEVVEDDGNYTICAVYPSRRSSDPNECLPGSRGRMNTRDNDVVVDGPEVSRGHAETLGINSAIYLRYLGIAYGSFLSRHNIRETEQLLRHWDRLPPAGSVCFHWFRHSRAWRQ